MLNKLTQSIFKSFYVKLTNLLNRGQDFVLIEKDVSLLSRTQQCEMCGSETSTSLVEIDHVELYACPKCAKFIRPKIAATKE